MKNLFKDSFFLGIFFVSFIFAGCGNPLGDGASKIDGNYGYGLVPPAPTGQGVVSGSVQGGVSVAQRRADISVGSVTSAIKLTTDSNRTVFVSVQGQIISK